MLNPARVDAIIDLAYGALIILSVGLIAVLDTAVGLAFGIGVFSSYVLHVVWKMARFDPDWMTKAVEQTVGETVEKQVEDVQTQVEETVEQTVGETVEEQVEDVQTQVEETVEQTVGETVEEQVEDVQTQVEETVEQTVGETVEEQVEAVNERINRRPREDELEEIIEESVEDESET